MENVLQKLGKTNSFPKRKENIFQCPLFLTCALLLSKVAPFPYRSHTTVCSSATASRFICSSSAIVSRMLSSFVSSLISSHGEVIPQIWQAHESMASEAEPCLAISGG